MKKRIGTNQRMKRNRKLKNIWGFASKIVFKKYLVICLVVVLAVAVIFGGQKYLFSFLDKKGCLKIEEVVVKGVSRSRQETIENTSSEFFDRTMFGFAKKEVQKKLRVHKWIKSVRIRRKFPSKIEVLVTKRVPVAMINLGKVYLADKSGYLWKLQAGVYWDLPLINGIKDTLKNGRRSIKENYKPMLMSTLKILKMRKEEGMPLVSQIEFVEEGREAVVKIRSGVAFAKIKTDDMERSVKRIGRIIEYSSYSNSAVLLIDLTYKHMAFVKTKRKLYCS